MEKTFAKTQGLFWTPLFFRNSKLKWHIDNVERTRQKSGKRENCSSARVDTWLIWNLTKGKVHVTDYSNASTSAFQHQELKWDEYSLNNVRRHSGLVPMNRRSMPSSGAVYGVTDAKILGARNPDPPGRGRPNRRHYSDRTRYRPGHG